MVVNILMKSFFYLVFCNVKLFEILTNCVLFFVFQISLDAKIRATVDKAMSDPDENTFELAQQHIFDLMHRDCLPRFLKSKVYKQLTKR